MPAQHLLDKFLRDPVRQFGGAPRAGEVLDALDRLARGRQTKARQFMAGIAGEIGDVGRKIGGQAERADLLREAEAAEMLHGPRLRRIGLRIEGRARLLIDQNGADAAPAKLIGQH